MNEIKLIALDLDGTLFNNQSQISARNKHAINAAIQKGVHVVLSTGRPYAGIPKEAFAGTGISYAITTNGSSIYELATGTCLYENAMEEALVVPIIKFLLTCDIHMDAFINGKGYTPAQCVENGQKINAPDSIKKYITSTRIRVDDLVGFIEENHLKVQKMTLNFHPDAHGVLVDRETVREYLTSNPRLATVCGGYNNLEFTNHDANKGIGLKRLASLLHVPMECTIAIGDTENDLAIIEAAGIGVAMGNATDSIKDKADYITTSNTEDGVAAAIEHFLL